MTVLRSYRRTTVSLIISALGLIALVLGFTLAASVGHSTRRADLQTYQSIPTGRVQPVTGTVSGDVYDLYTTSTEQKPCASQDATMQNAMTVLSDSADSAVTVDDEHYFLVAQLETRNGMLTNAGLPAEGADQPIAISCSSGTNFTVKDAELNAALAAHERPYQVVGGLGVAAFLIFGMIGWRVGLAEHRATH